MGSKLATVERTEKEEVSKMTTEADIKTLAIGANSPSSRLLPADRHSRRRTRFANARGPRAALFAVSDIDRVDVGASSSGRRNQPRGQHAASIREVVASELDSPRPRWREFLYRLR